MKLLLDTHIVLWALTRSSKLSREGWGLLEDEHNPLVVSAVSIWEIAIKHSRGQGRANSVPMSGTSALSAIRDANFTLLEITLDHAATVDHLEPHHRDPFDRLLVAQARSETMHLLTHDARLAAYGDFVIVV